MVVERAIGNGLRELPVDRRLKAHGRIVDVVLVAMSKRSGAGRICWCGSGLPHKQCHRPFERPGPGAALYLAAHPFEWAVRPAPMTPQCQAPAGVLAPDYAPTGTPATGPISEIRTPEEIERLRRAGRRAADVLVHLAGLVRPGVTTDDIDAEAFAECVRRGIYPSTLNYFDYPKSICTSVNEVICHGVPDSRPLRSGDTVNLDVTVFVEGVHGDCSATLCVGEVNPVARALVRTALLCVQAGVQAVRPGRPFSDIGAAIDDVARSRGHSVVTQFVCHGIGPRFHTGLQVLHHRNRDARRMVPGMVFTVEPMVNAGAPAAVLWDNGWTAVTADLARSAQFEHTVLVTETGVDILTPNPMGPV